MPITRADFDDLVRAYALHEATSRDFEAWVYANADELEALVGLDLFVALLAADYSDDSDLVDTLNPYFRDRFSGSFASWDLRTLKALRHSTRGEGFVLRSLD